MAGNHLYWCIILPVVTASASAASYLDVAAASACSSNGGAWKCLLGCYDDEDEACHTGLSEMDCAEIYGHVTWGPMCNCYCEELVCGMGCMNSVTGVCEGGNEEQCGAATLLSYPVQWTTGCNCTLTTGNVDAGATSDRATTNIYFSVPAFVVLFRESLEVVIVLVVIIQFLNKSRQDGIIDDAMFYRFRREVYLGASIGFSACLVMGIGFLVLASLVYGLFEGDNELIFEFCMMLITAFVLSFLALNFYKMIHTREGHERKMKKKLEETIDTVKGDAEGAEGQFGKKHAFFILAFSTGLREGLESIIFLAGVVSDVKDLSALPLPIITALISARLVGCCFFQGTKGMRVDMFMRFSAVFLCFIAAGMASSSMHNLQELDAFGTWSPRAERPWQNQKVWDATECCSDKSNRFFVLMRAMLGWQDQMTPVEIFAYLGYWVIAITVGSIMVAKAKKDTVKLLQKWRLEDAELKDGVDTIDDKPEAAPEQAKEADELPQIPLSTTTGEK